MIPRFLFLFRLNFPYRQPSYTVPSHLALFRCVPYAYGIRKTRNTSARHDILYIRNAAHLECAFMCDFTFVLCLHACMCANETLSNTTERHTSTPRSRISISIPSLYGLDGLSLSLFRSIRAIKVRASIIVYSHCYIRSRVLFMISRL